MILYTCVTTFTGKPCIKIEGLLQRHILGGADVHIKGIGSTPIQNQSKTGSSEALWDHYPSLSIIEILLYMYVLKKHRVSVYLSVS